MLQKSSKNTTSETLVKGPLRTIRNRTAVFENQAVQNVGRKFAAKWEQFCGPLHFALSQKIDYMLFLKCKMCRANVFFLEPLVPTEERFFDWDQRLFCEKKKPVAQITDLSNHNSRKNRITRHHGDLMSFSFYLWVWIYLTAWYRNLGTSYIGFYWWVAPSQVFCIFYLVIFPVSEAESITPSSMMSSISDFCLTATYFYK